MFGRLRRRKDEPGSEELSLPVEVRVNRDRPPPGDLMQWREDVSGGTWAPPGTSVEIIGARFTDVRVPRTHFDVLLVAAATFQRVTFDQVEVNAGDLGVADGTLYRESTFDRCFLAGVDPGLARFERCRFKSCNLDGWFANCAEFVSCTFDGSSLRDSIFFGHPFECGDATQRKTNEFRDNDFTNATIEGTRFDGINLTAQRLPVGPEVIDDAAARVKAAAKAIAKWPDEDRRRAATGVLAILVRPGEKPKQLVLDPGRFTDPMLQAVVPEVFELLRQR